MSLSVDGFPSLNETIKERKINLSFISFFYYELAAQILCVTTFTSVTFVDTLDTTLRHRV